MVATRKTKLDPSAFLPSDVAALRVVDDIIRCGAPLCVVRSGTGLAAVLETDLRAAIQDRFDPSVPIGELARDDVVFADEASAARRLDEDPTLPAVVVDAGGAVTSIERELPAVTDAVVMAGGLGQRLRPLTEDLPKPLLEVAGRPILFRILELLRRHGVERVQVSINYLGDKIVDAVGDGGKFGLEVGYLEEQEELGTAAGLAQLGEARGPFFVINGDILTDTDLRAMARAHLLRDNLATVATYLFPAPLPYGLVHRDGELLTRIEEKPVFRYPVNAGIYAFSPAVLEHVENGRPLAMVDFLNERAAAGDRIGRFALVEYWNDVGSPPDFERAQREVPAQ